MELVIFLPMLSLLTLLWASPPRVYLLLSQQALVPDQQGHLLQTPRHGIRLHSNSRKLSDSIFFSDSIRSGFSNRYLTDLLFLSILFLYK